MPVKKSSIKIENWGGVNKNKVRLTKLNYIRQLIKELKARKVDPKMLTFPGTKAFLERMAVKEGMLDPSDIVSIQTYEKMSEGHNGEPLLKELISVRNKELKGMYVWPYNFETFSQLYTSTGLQKPELKKLSVPMIGNEMNNVVSRPFSTFNIMDIDYCGIFSKKNADSIENLFKNTILDDFGVMFVTHQKGRDVRGGNLLNILHGYLKDNPLVDFDSIPHIHDEDKVYQYFAARYYLVPIYYVCKAYDNGYLLSLDRLIEYRDKAGSYNLAVNMLQFVFKWKKMVADKDHELHKQDIRNEVVKICKDNYTFTEWVD